MEIKINPVLEVSEHDLNAWKDVLYDLTFYDSFLEKMFEVLPDHIKHTAYTWGLSDTCFRDAAHTWFLEEFLK